MGACSLTKLKSKSNPARAGIAWHIFGARNTSQAADEVIDKLVYELYRLAEEEIKIVESS